MPLLPETAEAALKAAQVFIARYKDYDRRCKAASPTITDHRYGFIGACKERAALRRASLDLTRALAGIRKPGGA